MFARAEYLPCSAPLAFPQDRITAHLHARFDDYIADGVLRPKADCLIAYSGIHLAQSFSKLVNHIEGVDWRDDWSGYFASSAAAAAGFEEVLDKVMDKHVVVAFEDGYFFIELF